MGFQTSCLFLFPEVVPDISMQIQCIEFRNLIYSHSKEWGRMILRNVSNCPRITIIFTQQITSKYWEMKHLDLLSTRALCWGSLVCLKAITPRIFRFVIKFLPENVRIIPLHKVRPISIPVSGSHFLMTCHLFSIFIV